MIMDGEDLQLLTGPREIRGVSVRWLALHALQLTDAPPWYSLRARMLGELCGSCDLSLPMGCACPPSQPLVTSTEDRPIESEGTENGP